MIYNYGKVFCQRLINEKLITPSLAEVLFGDESRVKRALSPMTLAKEVHEVCLFYTAIVQAYLVGIAQQRGVTIKELVEYKDVVELIYDEWTKDDTKENIEKKQEEKKSESETTKKCFSFILTCSMAGYESLVAPNKQEFIKYLRILYGNITNDDIRQSDTVLSEEYFIEFLKILPLLSKTEIDKKNRKIIITTKDNKVECDIAPYLVFFNSEGEFTPRVTDNVYVITSVKKGERDDELKFNYIKINSAGKDPITTCLRRRVAGSDNLIMICRAIGVETLWCADDYWCDFAFIKKLADATYCSLTNVLELDSPLKASFDCGKELKKLFCETDIENLFSDRKKILPPQIRTFIYEIFITQGVYKSMFSLMYATDNSSEKVVERVFDEIMRYFKEKEIITDGVYTDRLNKCAKRIEKHVEKLAKIVNKETKGYRVRCNEIVAEQRTICLLKAAGIKNEKIIADAEEIVSIDDLFDALKNPEIPIRDNIAKALSILCRFYGALLKNSAEFDAEKYYKDVALLENEYSEEKEIEFLFESFYNIVLQSQGNAVIEKLIGRDQICDIEKLGKFKKDIIDLNKENKDSFNKSLGELYDPELNNERYVFISYSRADNLDENPQITRFTEELEARGINYFLDKKDIKPGKDWRAMIRRKIQNPDMAMFCLFLSRNSVLSEYVDDELSLVLEEAETRFGENKDRKEEFIVTVYLENEDINDFFRKMKIRAEDEEERVSFFKKNLSKKSYVKISDVDQIEKNFKILDEFAEEKFGKIDKDPIIQDVDGNIYAQVTNFFSFLKFGDNAGWKREDEVESYFDSNDELSYCIFPIVASIRETRIKRDNTTVIGYEIITGKGRDNATSNYILSSKKLEVDEYYCVPNYKAVGEKCSWMVEPLLISYDKFIGEKKGN